MTTSECGGIGIHMKIYGPYKRDDGRSHMIIINDHGVRYTQSYPRYLMEQHLGRKLEEWETVDHINGDSSDDRIENFQLLTRSENVRKSARPTPMYTFICPVCKKETSKRLSQVVANQGVQDKAGPFCGRKCAGTYSRRNQLAV